MLLGKYLAFAVVGLLAFASLPVQADTLTMASNTKGQLSVTTAPGQSITTPTGNSFDHLTFNWYDASLAPTASGTLYLLAQAYTNGNAANLSSATSGFQAASVGIQNGQYYFDPTVTLTGGTQYFFYANQSLTFSGGGNTYSGGIAYFPINNDSNSNFISTERLDMNFLLKGTPAPVSANGIGAVPEPTTVTFLAVSALMGAAFLRRRKQIGKPV